MSNLDRLGSLATYGRYLQFSAALNVGDIQMVTPVAHKA